MTTIRFAEPTRELASLGTSATDAVLRVLGSGQYVLGAEVEAFEHELAHTIGRSFAVGVSSGSDALTMALLALGVTPGDEVILPAYSFVATAEAVVRAGATPCFVDVGATDALIDPHCVERAIGPKTKAIVAVDLYGRIADYDRLQRYGLPIVEDGAQVLGRRGAMRATLACTSFFPSKPLGAAGDGGAVLTDDPALRSELVALRQHGRRGPHRYDRLGGNYRLDALQAALLRVKLPHLATRNERRLAIASRLFRALGSSAEPTLPFVALRVVDPQAAAIVLQRHAVAFDRHYPYVLSDLPPFRTAAPEPPLPGARAWAKQVMCFPCHGELEHEEIERLLAAASELATVLVREDSRAIA